VAGGWGWGGGGGGGGGGYNQFRELSNTAEGHTVFHAVSCVKK
jgi:hypothetical protein